MVSDPVTVAAIVQELLVGASFTSVKYATFFHLELSHGTEKSMNPRLPMVMWLTLISEWWLGDRDSWEKFRREPMTYLPVCKIEEEAKRAYALVCLIGSEIEKTQLGKDGMLTISTSAGASLHLSGREDIFEESWIIDVPRDVPNNELWSVVCTDEGELFGRRPV